MFYVSYDGIGEPLGRSQVLAYLFRLACDYDITLFSFEKPDSDRVGLAAELQSHGIDWRPLRYHKRPPVVSTLVDVLRGWWVIVSAARRGRPDIVHVRSYVPALMALWARRWTTRQLLFDIRGFWPDERMDGGIWLSSRIDYRLLYRLSKWCEARFFSNAAAVVTLTHASVPQIRAWSKRPKLSVTVIPTCVDLERFSGCSPREQGPCLTWCGSIGTWYRFDLVPLLERHVDLPLQVITRQADLAATILRGGSTAIVTLAPDEVPGVLHPGDVGLSLCVSSFSKIASAPTRFAEYLAAGMPVVITPGVGDTEEIVEQHRVGIILHGEDDAAAADAASRLRELRLDAELPERCRRVARELFDVEAGARAYGRIYEQLLGR